MRRLPLLRVSLAWLLCQGAANAVPEAWPVAGQQGVLRFVIVPTELARDRAAYARQIELLCQPGQTCFLNFYTNTAGAALTVPLPDAIDHEATAVFRRSMKQGAELPFADHARRLLLKAHPPRRLIAPSKAPTWRSQDNRVHPALRRTGTALAQASE